MLFGFYINPHLYDVMIERNVHGDMIVSLLCGILLVVEGDVMMWVLLCEVLFDVMFLFSYNWFYFKINDNSFYLFW